MKENQEQRVKQRLEAAKSRIKEFFFVDTDETEWKVLIW